LVIKGEKMLTIQEYKDKYQHTPLGSYNNIDLWIPAIDLMEHILKFQQDNTIFKNAHHSGVNQYIDILRNEIDKDRDDFETFNEAFDNAYIPTKKYKPERADDGELLIDAYIGGEKKPFEDMVQVLEDSKKALSIFINFGLNYGERHGNSIDQAYKEVYRIAASCEADNRPCRVIGTFADRVDEDNRSCLVRLMVVLKDYNDPIFPTIWAGINNNLVAHALCVCVFAFLIGTTDLGMGRMITFQISDIVESDEDVLTFGGKLEYRK
jgi:hypothetical protein